MGVEARHLLPNQLIENVVAHVVLRHVAVPQGQESLVHDQGHENIKSELFVLEVAQEARCDVVHALAVSDFRQHESDRLQHVKQLLRLLFRKKTIIEGILGALEVNKDLMLQLLVEGCRLESILNLFEHVCEH